MDNFVKILDALTEYVYISDMETHEILYVNKPAARLLGSTWRDRPCYEVIQGLDKPCPFCTNHLLKSDAFYTWEHYNEKFDRFYSLRDEIIQWNGRPARFEIAFDQTEQVRGLKAQLGLETLLVRCIMELQDIDGFSGDIVSVLRMIGEFLGADRVYLFQVTPDGKAFSNTHEWCAPSVEPQIDQLQNMDIENVRQWMPMFLERETIIVKDLEEIKDTFPNEYAMLSPQGIVTMVDAPLLVEGELIGSIGVDNPAAIHLDHCGSFFESLSYFLSMELERYQARERFRKLSYTDALTGLANRNRYIADVSRLDEEDPRSDFGVAYLDLNGLKAINDEKGHAEGDRALVRAAEVLREAFPRARVYRLGGDEFLIVSLDSLESEFRAQAELAQKMLEDRACSMAMGLFYAIDPCMLEDAVVKADAAMYDDKRSFYDERTRP